MFEIRNDTEVWYKSEDMETWIHYGNTPVLEKIAENNYELKEFNIKKQEYELSKNIKKFEYNGNIYDVLEGKIFIIDNENVKEEPEPTEQELFQAELLLTQQDIILTQQEQEKALAQILLEQQGGIENV